VGGAAARQEVGQQHVQPADQSVALGDQVPAAVYQQPQHDREVFGHDRAQAAMVRRGDRHRAGVGWVALAPGLPRQQPSPG
jgi:hypothetical protein